MIWPVEPRRQSNKWPAIILADKRIAKVIGRIMFLIVSIKTINIIKAVGVLRGTKWAKDKFVILYQL